MSSFSRPIVAPAPRSVPSLVVASRESTLDVGAAVRAGSLLRLRRGVYAPPDDGAAADDGRARALRREQQVLERIAAVNVRLSTRYWFSHSSAALLWGSWLWRPTPSVHVTHCHPDNGEKDDWLVRHWTALPERDRTEIGGLPVTTRERTAVDCALALPPEQSAPVVDSLLRAGASSPLIQEILTESAGKRGVRCARRVLSVADGVVESPGESRLRWILVERGLPTPEAAIAVATWLGTRWIDLGWPDLQVGLEFDGAVKYSGGEYGNPQERLLAEKQRHDALVEAGWLIVRVTWADLADPDRLVSRVLAALRRRAAPSPR